MITTPAPAAYYDQIYATSPHYAKSADELSNGNWFAVWKWACGEIDFEKDRILDLGCGPGHFAELLVSQGFDPARYLGVDFSQVAVAHAKARVPGATFKQAELPAPLSTLLAEFKPTVVTALEVIEHMAEDIEKAILSTGYRTLISVPMMDDPSHMRFFPTQQSAVDYYGRPVYKIGPSHWGFEIQGAAKMSQTQAAQPWGNVKIMMLKRPGDR